MKQSKLAYVSGPTQPALLEQTVGQKFEDISRQFPDRIAVKTAKYALTYSEIRRQSGALAAAFSRNLGFVTGDRIAISLGNCAEYTIIVFACFQIGAIVVPLNPGYTSDQVISALNHVSAAGLILSTEASLPYKTPISTVPLLKSIIEVYGSVIKSNKVPSLRSAVLVGESSCSSHNSIDLNAVPRYEHLINLGKDLPHPLQPQHTPKINDTAMILFTSGTTSSPKAACLSQKSVINNSYLVGHGMMLTERDIICCPPPLYHCFGLVLGVLTAMVYGACLVLPSESFDAKAVLQSLERDRPSALYGVPTMFLSLLEELEKSSKQYDFSHLRTGIIGGALIPPELRLKLGEQLHLSNIANCYGLTEASPIISLTMPSDTLQQKLATVGQALAHTSVKVVSHDDSTKTLNRGSEKGELLVSGYCVMDGYWEDKYGNSKTLIKERYFTEGVEQSKVWLRSGDEAMIDEQGYITITGRLKDIIIRGGENIYPAEIEDVLLQHPVVANGSVLGLPDEKYGEVIAAFIVRKDGIAGAMDHAMKANLNIGIPIDRLNLSNDQMTDSESIKDLIRRRLGRPLVPKFVFWLAKLPLTASGKIEKYKLKDLGVEYLQSSRQIT